MRALKQMLVAAVLLGAMHGVLGLLPEPPFAPAMNLVLYVTNLFVVYCAATVLRQRPASHLGLFLVGYLVLFVLLLVILDKKPLFILLVVAYAGVFGSPVLLGFFAIFVLCFVFLQPYGFETFIPLALIYSVLMRLRRSASFFLLACLGGGLLALALVLLPLMHLALQDSAQTLWHAMGRAEVRDAVVLSLVTSTVSTLIVAVWGVPLAYALARLRFPGRRVIESIIDVPILVPQSVAGVALIVMLGQGSPLGQALDSLGLHISGATLGVIVAQVFVASPFLIKTAMTAFEAVPRELELASRSLGRGPAGTFLHVALPLASRGILVGGALAWARAVSELGCIILFASSPVTAPVLVHTEFLRAGVSESRPIAVLLLVICLWIFVVLQFGQTLLPFSARRGGGQEGRL